MRLFWDSYRNQFLMISTKSRQEVVRDLSRRDHCNSLKQYLKHLEANHVHRKSQGGPHQHLTGGLEKEVKMTPVSRPNVAIIDLRLRSEKPTQFTMMALKVEAHDSQTT